MYWAKTLRSGLNNGKTCSSVGITPFSGGPRAYLGQELALIEHNFVLARLLQTLGSIESSDRKIAYIKQSRLTVRSRNGVEVIFHIRESERLILVSMRFEHHTRGPRNTCYLPMIGATSLNKPYFRLVK